MGDPTEGALLTLARKVGLDPTPSRTATRARVEPVRLRCASA